MTTATALREVSEMAPNAKPDFVLQTSIRCAPEALWDAITNPETIAKHHFMGSSVDLQGEVQNWTNPEGTVFLKMRILESRPFERFVTTFEPQMSGDGAPSRVVTTIRVEEDVCILTLEHHGLTFEVVPGESVHDGWSRWAASLKTYLETGIRLPISNR